MKKYLALFLALAMTLGVFAGCTKTETPAGTGGDQQKAEPVLYMSGAPLDEANSRFRALDISNNYVSPLIWDTLLDYDVEKAEYVPTLAEKYEWNEDNTVLTITLKDAKWHDGKPVVAKDVVTTTKLLALENGYGEELKGFEAFVNGETEDFAGVIEKDEKTVVFELVSPSYKFHEDLANANWSILPDHIFGGMSHADALIADYWVKPIGTGPYMIKDVNYPNYITLTRYDDYHTGKAGIKDVVVNIYADTDAEVAAMMAGKLHFLANKNETDIKTILGANSHAKMLTNEASFTKMLQFNLSDHKDARDDLKNVKIRQALSMIIDRQAVVDYVGAQASLATTYHTFNHNPDIPEWKRNLEEGKKLLQDEGFDFSKPLRIYSSVQDQLSIDILDIIVASLKEAGVEATVNADKPNASTILYETLDFDLYYGSINGVDGAGTYYLFDSTSTYYTKWYTDALNKSNAERYGTLVKKAAATPDEEEQDAINDQLQIMATEDCFCIPIWHRGSIWAMDERFTGFDSISDDWKACALIDTTTWKLVD